MSGEVLRHKWRVGNSFLCKSWWLTARGVHDIKPTKYTNLFLKYIYYNVTHYIPTCCGPQGTIIWPVLTFVKYVGWSEDNLYQEQAQLYNSCTKKCVHFKCLTLVDLSICVEKWLIWFYTILPWFYFLMMVPCGSKHVGIISVTSLCVYTGCHRRNGPNFRRVFFMLNYTDITQNTYVPSWTVIEIIAK